MAELVVHGGKRLMGTVRAAGSKNAAVTLLPAALLAREPVRIDNVPPVADVEAGLEALAELGVQAGWAEGSVVIDLPRLQPGTGRPHVAGALARRWRASILFLAPLLARCGEAVVGWPGGCRLGSRPIDWHLKALRAMGATIEVGGGYIVARARRLFGAEIHLDYPSVGVTEQILLAAATADGRTIIHNAARDPEVIDLATFLGRLGARVFGVGTPTVRIDGVPALGGAHHTVMPDRVEAGTYLWMAVATGGDVRVEGVIPEHLDAVLNKVAETGASIERGDDWVRAVVNARPAAVRLITQAYPGFPSDLQPIATAALCRAQGTSLITETVFPHRFDHVAELRRLGASLTLEGSTAIVEGTQTLTGAPLAANDLRAAAALLVGALAAEGSSTLDSGGALHRGYPALTEKLAALGAGIGVPTHG
ncbi:MAG TPA: UDP-N-acetylglucosamine 1-carboxyvinyltransferase [Limnochordia bacterium]